MLAEPVIDEPAPLMAEPAVASPELAEPVVPEPASPEPEPVVAEPDLHSAPELVGTDADTVTEATEAPFFLGALEASAELTEAQRRALYQSMTLESIGAEEEVRVTGLSFIVDGLVSVMATVSDVPAGSLKTGEALFAKSSIADTMSLRLVAEADPTKVASWDLGTVEEVLGSATVLIELLTQASNRMQAIAGCSMGPLGERLDEGLRASVIERLEVRVLQPDTVIAPAGLPVPGMIIVGVGSLELDDGERLGPGDFLFATEVLGAEAAPKAARAGARGAIIFFGARALAQELLVTCPPLLEIFAGM
jgi:hypothetical protein